jgi:hypothetical protein
VISKPIASAYLLMSSGLVGGNEVRAYLKSLSATDYPERQYTDILHVSFSTEGAFGKGLKLDPISEEGMEFLVM